MGPEERLGSWEEKGPHFGQLFEEVILGVYKINNNILIKYIVFGYFLKSFIYNKNITSLLYIV